MTDTSKYLSPLVSCLTCREVKSAKGIFSHFITSHTEEGKSRLSHTSKIRRKESKNTTKAREVRTQYNNNPNKCYCGNILTYNSRKNKYCSHSCATIKNNSVRGPMSDEIKQKIKETYDKKPKPPAYSAIKYIVCKECNNEYCFSKNKPSASKMFCSTNCFKINKARWASTHFRKINSGGVRKSKQIEYNGVKLGSTYEVKLAKILDSIDIIWNKPKRINYIKPTGKSSTYTADFYLPEYNLYLDPKNNFLINHINPGNGYKDIDKIAWVVEQNNITVAIIDSNNITESYIQKLVGQAGFEPAIILSCKDSGFDHSHHCPIIYM